MNFIALSGLPRTGSTLLSAILSQNPNIHAEGNSAVCQLMWDMQVSCEKSEQLQASPSRKFLDQDALVSAIPQIYYRGITAEYIVDKCRSWTLSPNMEMMRRYITKQPKVIVMLRPIDEIIESFEKLYRSNNSDKNTSSLLEARSEPLMRSLEGVEQAQENNNGEFLFIEYHDLVNNTVEVINTIYRFCELKIFRHNFQNIVNKFPEDDEVYGLKDMHKIYSTIRPQIQSRSLEV